MGTTKHARMFGSSTMHKAAKRARRNREEEACTTSSGSTSENEENSDSSDTVVSDGGSDNSAPQWRSYAYDANASFAYDPWAEQGKNMSTYDPWEREDELRDHIMPCEIAAQLEDEAHTRWEDSVWFDDSWKRSDCGLADEWSLEKPLHCCTLTATPEHDSRSNTVLSFLLEDNASTGEMSVRDRSRTIRGATESEEAECRLQKRARRGGLVFSKECQPMTRRWRAVRRSPATVAKPSEEQ